MAEVITITLPIPPSANRYWRNCRGRMVVSKEAKDYKERVGWLLKAEHCQPISGPIDARIKVFRARRAGDLDNFLKVIFDALKGIAFADDDQIVRIEALRRDDKRNPRVEVELWAESNEQPA